MNSFSHHPTRIIVFFCLIGILVLTGCSRSVRPTTRLYKPKAPVEASKQAASPSAVSAKIPQGPQSAPKKETFVHGRMTNGALKASSNASGETLDDALAFCELAQEYWENGELEDALDALDQAYSLILRVDDNIEDVHVIQEREDLRFLIAKRILEIHASRQTVANGTHEEIPIIMNSHVQNEINKFTGVEKEFFRNAYIRSGRYRDYIVGELQKEGMPEELSWLPLIESGFKTRAMSPARALGMWQFIPSTGYKYGLSRNEYIDERMDPAKATAAAIAYMKELHNMFGDWMTVLAAYNCGEGRVLRTINSQNVNYLDNFWDLYKKLPRETARYVPRFLATLHIIKNKAQFGLDTVRLAPPMSYDVAKINRRSHLKNFATALNVSEGTLKRLNPELRQQITPNQPYFLKVPWGKAAWLESNIHTVAVSVPKPPKKKLAHHKVRRGQHITAIARRYGVSIRTIARANNLNRRYTIHPGQVLKIPLAGSGYVAKTTKPKPTYKPITHRVRKGDSLWNLARRYGTTTRTIQRANKMRGTTLKIGQKLSIPAGRSYAKSGKKTYRVRKGDTPFIIAKRSGMSLGRFLRLNKMSKRSKIYPGQKVYVE